MFKPMLTAGALTLATLLPAAALDLDAMTDAERDAFRAEVRAYLLDNPEVLMEAIGVLEDRQAAEQAANDAELLQVNAEALFNDPTSWVGGNPDGDITVVEFLDYRCGYCRRAHPEVAELIASDGNIRLIVKEFPILGDESVLASRFALGVREVEGDGAYKEVNDALMAFRGNMTEQGLSDLSESLGYDTPAVFAAMNGEAVQQTIVNNRALGQRMGINGTPSFVFGDELVRGYVPLDGMREIIEDVRGES
ncbi:MAG: DsbA family protein [Pseudomonadota bacterium]